MHAESAVVEVVLAGTGHTDKRQRPRLTRGGPHHAWSATRPARDEHHRRTWTVSFWQPASCNTTTTGEVACRAATPTPRIWSRSLSETLCSKRTFGLSHSLLAASRIPRRKLRGRGPSVAGHQHLGHPTWSRGSTVTARIPMRALAFRPSTKGLSEHCRAHPTPGPLHDRPCRHECRAQTSAP